MASIADIRAGLKANLVAAGFTNVNLYTLSNPTPPCMEIDLAPDGVDFDGAMRRGHDTITMLVRAVLADSSDYGAQVTLDTYIDGAAGTDVKTALERDLTLAGAAQALQVTAAQPRRWKSDTTGGLLVGVEWTVVVYAAGAS